MTLLAFKLRIAVETGWAETTWTMMFRNAVSMNTTGSTNAAWILALALIAALVDRAVVVATATIEAPMRFADFSKGTFFISGALDFGYASSIIASPLWTTVMFPAANVRVCQALGVWVAQSLRRARARKTVVDRLAQSVQAARSNKLARVLTLATDTCLVVWAARVRPAALKAPVVLADHSDTTVGINHTLHLGAFHLGIASVARATSAVRTVVHRLALSVGSTCRRACARVHALTIDAGLCCRTISIRPAPRKAQSSFANVVPGAQRISCTNQAAPLFNAAFVVEALIVAAACNSTNSGLTITSKATLIICMAFL